jgi:hypothetical protein
MRYVEVLDFRIDEPEVEDLIRKVYLGQLSLAAPESTVAELEPAVASET